MACSPGKLYERRSEHAECEHYDEHQRNRERLAVLDVQRADLAGCLDELWLDIQNGRRRFKLYRQLKMYNDPDLNPVLYRSAIAGSTKSGEG